VCRRREQRLRRLRWVERREALEVLRHCRQRAWLKRESRDAARHEQQAWPHDLAMREGAAWRGLWDWSACDWDRWGREHLVGEILFVTFVSFSRTPAGEPARGQAFD